MFRMRVFAILVFLVLFGGTCLADPKSQCEELLDSALPFAKKMLAEYGEFYPYGATLQSNGKIGSVGGYKGEEHPPSQSIIDFLRQAFRTQASEKTIIASALVYDVRTVPPGQSQKTDAIAVELDHRDNYSMVVYFPYVITNAQVQLGSPFATKGVGRIFGPVAAN